MRQHDHDGSARAHGARDAAACEGDREPGAGELRDLLGCLHDGACIGERLGLAARFARFAARADIADGLRRTALRAVQDLARRKQEEAACVRGLAVMQTRVKSRAKR